MQVKSRFKKGDMVKVINPNNHFYDEVAEILMFDEREGKYLLQFNNGYKCSMYPYDLVRHLSHKEQRKLQKAHLLQLADLALAWNDEDWFNKITKRLKDFKE
jgi:uncharacterized protein YpiB (UPF0302 family)